MCGIAGAAWNDAEDFAVDEPTLVRALETIRHRGPDAWGTKFFGDQQPVGCALGHRRLSIIDLSEQGRQPMSNEDGTVWVTFNGEIYNYTELRPSLEAAGHRFHTDTDTEVLVHLWEEHGENLVDHLRGMFAFAIWDDRQKTLFLARDRTGQKPLYFTQSVSDIAFASELKPLLIMRPELRQLDVKSLALYLTYQYVPARRSIFENIGKLGPGCCATWTASTGEFNERRYWTPPFAEPDTSRTPEQWARDLRDTLTEAVRLRMRSDVPIGAFLSGGIDSSITAGLMQSLSPEPIHTFSIGFPQKQYDETHYAREAAERLGTNHHVHTVDPSALETLPSLIWHYDEPFADSSAIPTMYVSRVAREHVTVALSGDGGDELFAGYNRYEAVRLATRLDRIPGMAALFKSSIWSLLPKSGRQKSLLRRARRFAEGMAAPVSERYLRWISHFDPAALHELLTPEFRDQLGQWSTASLINDAYKLCPNRDVVTQTCAADVETYLPNDILTKVDIASMAASLECRSPLLDHHVVELAARMPVELKIDRGRQKAILIETFKDLLPESIQTRSKMGFGVPIDFWFRNELKPLLENTLLSERSLDRGRFNPDVVRRYVREHLDGTHDQHYRLWNLLILELWSRAFLDTDMPVGPQDIDQGIA